MPWPAAPVSVLQNVVLFLGTAGVVMPLVKRLNFSPTLGFLLAGICSARS
jgi:Kef-type K+ transport system membrane component KefB